MESEERTYAYGRLKALDDELMELKTVRRKEVVDKIKKAREKGNLCENAEYDAAKEEQRVVEAQIEVLEEAIRETEAALKKLLETKD